jgi:hypothetical protein
MAECFLGGFGAGGGKVDYPLDGTTMKSASGKGGAAGNAATVTFTIDLSKRYFINACGSSTALTAATIGGELWFYDGNGAMSTVIHAPITNSSLAYTLSGTTLTVTDTIASAYGATYTCYVRATLIPLDA